MSTTSTRRHSATAHAAYPDLRRARRPDLHHARRDEGFLSVDFATGSLRNAMTQAGASA